MLSSLLFLLAAEAPPVPVAPANLEEPNPSAMSSKEIREFNTQITRTHRWYIRCVTSPETGSLVKASKVCRTNEQWRNLNDRGNDGVREIYQTPQSAAVQSPN